LLIKVKRHLRTSYRCCATTHKPIPHTNDLRLALFETYKRLGWTPNGCSDDAAPSLAMKRIDDIASAL